MELWIRSQGKELLVLSKGFEFQKLYDGRYQIFAVWQNNYQMVGVYETKERALEVLSEIQGRITSNEALRAMFPKVTYIEGCEEEYGKLFRDMIYQMPKE